MLEQLRKITPAMWLDLSSDRRLAMWPEQGGRVRSFVIGGRLTGDTASLSVLTMEKPFADLWVMCRELTQRHDPGLLYTSVTVNKNWWCARHRDSAKADDPSCIMGLGSFEGGELWVEPENVDDPARRVAHPLH